MVEVVVVEVEVVVTNVVEVEVVMDGGSGSRIRWWW